PARRRRRLPCSRLPRSPNVHRDVVAELVELELPAAPVFLRVLCFLLLRAGEASEPALDHAQARALALLGEAELDEGGVELGVAWALARAQPVEGDEARWIDSLDPPVDRAVLVPCEGQLAAGSQIDRRRVAEPAADVLGLGDHRPHDLARRFDQDLAFDALRNHVRSSRLCNRWLRNRIRRATDGCGSGRRRPRLGTGAGLRWAPWSGTTLP